MNIQFPYLAKCMTIITVAVYCSLGLGLAQAEPKADSSSQNPASFSPAVENFGSNNKSYPAHWGEPPRIQTQDIGPLPGGYGMGSSTLRGWIQQNLDQDAKIAKPGEGNQTKGTANDDEIQQVEKKIAEMEAFAMSARFTPEGLKKHQEKLAVLKERLRVLKGDSSSNSGALNPAVPAVIAPVIKAGEKVALTGKLHGGMMAIGGETTGWQLACPTSQGAQLEVDMAAINHAESLDGKEVIITGSIISKSYVERGAVLILKAEKVQAAPISK